MIILMSILYAMIMINLIVLLESRMASYGSMPYQKPDLSYTLKFMLPRLWLIRSLVLLYLNAFFLFCGMFILPLVMGMWK
jgi:hypothetical protein